VEGFAPEGDSIAAHRDDVTKHIERLWGEDFKTLALDCGRDPSDSNTTIVRLVADLRLADETRRMRVAAWWAILAALLVGVIGAVATFVAAASYSSN
jgi:hypothetical protein